MTPHYHIYVATEYTQVTLEVYSDSLRLLTMETTLHVQNVLGMQIHLLPAMIASLPTLDEKWFRLARLALLDLLMQLSDKNLHLCTYTIYLHNSAGITLIDSGN